MDGSCPGSRAHMAWAADDTRLLTGYRSWSRTAVWAVLRARPWVGCPGAEALPFPSAACCWLAWPRVPPGPEWSGCRDANLVFTGRMRQGGAIPPPTCQNTRTQMGGGSATGDMRCSDNGRRCFPRSEVRSLGGRTRCRSDQNASRRGGQRVCRRRHWGSWEAFGSLSQHSRKPLGSQ